MTDVTKKYKRLYALFRALSLLVIIGPLAYYTVMAFIEGEVTEKVTMGVTFMIAAVLVFMNLVMKYHIRSTVWVLVIGIYFCLDSIQLLLVLIASGTVLDEFVLTPLYKSYKNKFTINKEIDRRM